MTPWATDLALPGRWPLNAHGLEALPLFNTFPPSPIGEATDRAILCPDDLQCGRLNHRLPALLHNTGEAVAGLLRPGNAGSNTAADHITVTDLALAQIPDTERSGRPILIRADGAGATRDWLAHLRGPRDQNLDVDFSSVGFTMTPAVQNAIDALPQDRMDRPRCDS